jgi:muramidase (phage lysozyme)
MIEETGVGIKNPLWFVGVVENRNDPRLEGRVQVRAFGVHGTNAQVPTENLPWAICIAGNYDPNYPIPPLNSWVFGFFIDGRDAQQPMILGLIPTQMTQLIDPDKNGWGVIPEKNVNLDAQGSRATDFGQPMNSRKARGEELDKTDVLLQEVNRISADMSSIEENLAIEEPAPGNQSQYPYNRVTETAGGHCIELDDTPSAERVRLGHSEGTFMEMHPDGTTVLHSEGDIFLTSPRNIIIIAESRQIIKVKGDAIFSVDGNMVQEVNGDMQQIVRGNYELSVGGQLNLNGSEEIQARAAKLRFEANVEGINLKSGKSINIESGQSINAKAGISIFQEAATTFNIKSDNVKIGGGSKASMSASLVAIDDIVRLASGDSDAPAGAGVAESAEMPEPASKAAGNGSGSNSFSGGGYGNASTYGGGGYISQDDGAGGFTGGFVTETLDSSYTQGALTPLLDFIGRAEGAGYDTIVGFISRSDYPSRPITSMTVDEILAWQDSIDQKYNSEAVGRYQVIEDTLRGLKVSGIVSGNELFSPATQDKIAIALLKGRGLNRFLSDSITAEQFGDNLAKEWASLPVITGPNAGRGYYAGQGGKISTKEVLSVLQKVKDYKNERSSTTGPQ